MKKVCPKCGCKEFATTAVEYHDWIVDGDGNFIEDQGCYDADVSQVNEGRCTDCDAVFAGPHELKEV